VGKGGSGALIRSRRSFGRAHRSANEEAPPLPNRNVGVGTPEQMRCYNRDARAFAHLTNERKTAMTHPSPLQSAIHRGVRLDIVIGDITKLNVDAIVNAANTSLLGGGGVDGAIHRAAGLDLLAECRTLGGCPIGDAKITRGYRLPARHVIHAVGPVWGSQRAEECDRLLASCYQASLGVAAAHGLRSIAFPAISTGIYAFPADRAAQVAVGAVVSYLDAAADVQHVVFCCYNSDSARYHEDAFQTLGLQPT
jgi:O-acetyl-ADP-ribose deacetylase